MQITKEFSNECFTSVNSAWLKMGGTNNYN